MGGGPDLLARALAQPAGRVVVQSVTVENHPGAGSTVCARIRGGVRPRMVTRCSQHQRVSLQCRFLANLPYDPLKDFARLRRLTSQPYVLVAGASGGILSVGQLADTS